MQRTMSEVPRDRLYTGEVPTNRTTDEYNRREVATTRSRDVSRARGASGERRTFRREPSATRDQRESIRPTVRDPSRTCETRDAVSSLRTDEMLNDLRECCKKDPETRDRSSDIPVVDVCVIADEFGGTAIKALLDTGAMISAINSKVIREIEQISRTELDSNRVKSIFPRVKINKTHVRGAFDQKGIQADTMVQLTIEINDRDGLTKRFTYEFFEISTLFLPMILGADFLGRNQLAVVCHNATPIIVTDRAAITRDEIAPISRSPERDMISRPSVAQDAKVLRAANAVTLPAKRANTAKIEEIGETATEDTEPKVTVTSAKDVDETIDALKLSTSSVIDLDTEAYEPDPEILTPKRDEFERRLDGLLTRFGKLLDGSLGRVRNYEHEIRVTTEKPFKNKTYPIPRKHLEEVRRQIGEMEHLGVSCEGPQPNI